MRYFALACDYDGTLATEGQVNSATLEALHRLRQSGRKIILVTGRQLEDIRTVFPQLDLCDVVVAENGAVLYCPATRETQILAAPPPEAFVQALQSRQVQPLSLGKVIVASWHPQETTILQTIRDLGLELQVTFNKGAVMVLPSGINKASGLRAALADLGLSPHNVVAIGDAENDHTFMNLCEFSVAVANALPMIKERADWVTSSSRGEGVIELIEQLLLSDLNAVPISPMRHHIVLGIRAEQTPVYLPSYGTNVLIAGLSGGGKSTLATGILERLGKEGYQFCILDPEGDYERFEGAVVIGNRRQVPEVPEILDLLARPDQNLIVNLLGVGLDQRPAFLAELLPSLLELRSRTGRPHWLVIDEAHHLLPTSWQPAALTLPKTLNGILLITVHPDHIATPALSLVDTLIAVGQSPDKTFSSFCNAIGHCPPLKLPETLASGTALAWFQRLEPLPFQFEMLPPQMERQRHQRNYAEGNLGDDKSFYFRGLNAKLNLRAQNLMMFAQLAEGIDDETWQYHLQRGDYSSWFRNAIKDESLAQEVAQIEQSDLTVAESRDRVVKMIEQHYTLPI
jgi:phosphoglycolate phosphatase (TIGR01487 family)